MRRYENMSVHQVVQGIKITEIPWLNLTKNKRTRACVSGTAKKRALLEEFFVWLFNDYIVNLLRTNFYVTESAALQRRTLYFLQSDWATICEPLLDNMTKTLFQRMRKVNCLSYQSYNLKSTVLS